MRLGCKGSPVQIWPSRPELQWRMHVGDHSHCLIVIDFGAWRSLVARLVRDQEVPSSNLGAPTILFNNFRLDRASRKRLCDVVCDITCLKRPV